MPRFTVHIPDDVYFPAVEKWQADHKGEAVANNRSALVVQSLTSYLEDPARPERSERGRVDTLRSLRAARVALDDLEQQLTRAEPVRRRVRRYTPPRKGQSGT